MLLHSFIDAVYAFHKSPSFCPGLSDEIKTACTYRVAAGPSKPRVPVHIWPTPPNSQSASESSTHESTLKLQEKRFGQTGINLKSEDVFAALVRSRKGKERAVGEVWLDGETVSFPICHTLIS